MNKVIILAAGKGTRMKSELPKVLVKIKGRPMIEFLVDSIINSGVDKKPVIIVSPDNSDIIQKSLRNYDCFYAIQKEQLGTGHAIACAKKVVGKNIDYIISFYGDHPFIKAETIKKLSLSHNGAITMITTAVKDFKGWRKNFYHWGRIIRSGAQVKEIIEFKDACEEERKIREVNPGLYCFSSNWLWKNINKLKNNNVQKEYYLTDLIKLAVKQGIKINTFPIDPEEAIGINSVEELKVAEKILQ